MTSIDMLREAILRQRELQPTSSKAPGSSQLNRYAIEILGLKESGFTFAEIARALYIQYQIKTDERVLSKFLIRYRKRVEKQSSSGNTTFVQMKSSALEVQTDLLCSSSDVGDIDAVSPFVFARDERSGEGSTLLSDEIFTSTSTRLQNERKERQLKSKIFNFIETSKPIVRESFKKKYGEYPESFRSDLTFWKGYWDQQSS